MSQAKCCLDQKKDEPKTDGECKNNVKKYQPKQKTKRQIRYLKERKIRFNRSIYSSEDLQIDHQILFKLNSQYLERFLRCNSHSHPILLSSSETQEFVYKIVYKNGDGIKPQTGMGIKMRYKTSLIDGTQVNKSFGNIHSSQLVGRNKMRGIYEILSMNVSQGQIGSIVASPKYCYGDEGCFPLIPPFAALKIDYWVDELKVKEFWEYDENQKTDEIEAVLQQSSQILRDLRKENNNKISNKKIQFCLHRIRQIEDLASYSHSPRIDSIRKKICAYEIELVYYLQRKVEALELMNKYLQLQGRNSEGFHALLKEEELEKYLFPIKIKLQFEFGMIEEVKEDLSLIDTYSKKFNGQLQNEIQQWKKNIVEFQNLSPEINIQKKQTLKLHKQYIRQNQQKNQSSYQYTYHIKGFQPYNPENILKDQELNLHIEYDKIIEWVIGKQKVLCYLSKLKQGFQLKSEWEKAKKYENQFYNFKRDEENRKKNCQKNNENFKPGIWLQKKEEESWNEYYERRKQCEFQEKFLKIKRQYGEKESEYEERKNQVKEDMKKQAVEQKSSLSKRLQRKMKKGFKKTEVPVLPKQQAYKCFDIN